MKIGIAQTRPIKGNIAANIEAHKKFIDLALTQMTDAIFFPELSLTGYEPNLASKLATTQEDIRLDLFQDTSNTHNIIIGLGLPTQANSTFRISMILFTPNKPRQTYSKQLLHADELPYFEKGTEQVIITSGTQKIAPAICYESLQPSHSKNAFQLGSTIYLASVAKSETGIEKAFALFPTIAQQYAMPVLLTNSIGYCDNFLSAGQSAVWTKDGKLAGQLTNNSEGILLFDTDSEEVIECKL